MTLNQLSYLEEISVRSLNVCEDNGLLDLASMISYYQENKTFTNLKNCGRKSDEELTAICLKYIDKGNAEYSELVNKENKSTKVSEQIKRYFYSDILKIQIGFVPIFQC